LEDGIEIGGETFEWLWSVLCNWQTNIHDYIRAFDNDVPYFYNERASLSDLCGTAWQSGYPALEEFVAIKNDGSDKPNGRIDLYIGQRDGDGNREPDCESEGGRANPAREAGGCRDHVSLPVRRRGPCAGDGRRRPPSTPCAGCEGQPRSLRLVFPFGPSNGPD
jgi:hypothetical protein